MRSPKTAIIFLTCFIVPRLCSAAPLLTPCPDKHTRESAERFWKVANTTFAPLYGPMAEQIVSEFQLADKEGIGIDVGSGPGSLIVELCKRTKRIHWINADINPHFFPFFRKAAEEAGVGHRVSSIFVDAQAMPFRDDYADIIVSRGSFHLWEDRQLAFSEIYRVLKPGGVAFIGRGFSVNLSVDIARRIRTTQREKGSRLKYNVTETAAELREIMKSLGVKGFRVRIPKPPGSEGVSYGVWVEFHKPLKN